MNGSRKLWYIYTMEYYTAERKKELLPLVTAWMELESIMLSEIHQGLKDKYHFTYKWKLINKTKKQANYNRDIEIKNKLTINRREEGEGVIAENRGRVIKKHLYWTTSKGHMDNAKAGRTEGGRQGGVVLGGLIGGKWRQLYLTTIKKR